MRICIAQERVASIDNGIDMNVVQFRYRLLLAFFFRRASEGARLFSFLAAVRAWGCLLSLCWISIQAAGAA